MKWVLLLLTWFLCLGAAWQDIVENYWDKPAAAVKGHHAWSELEKNMRPEACAQCHQSQFDSWKHSRHAKAFSPGMVGQFKDMNHGSANNCLRCHAPLQQQLYSNNKSMLASLERLKNNPLGVDTSADMESKASKLPLRHAGVSCAVCHVRGGQRFGPSKRGSTQQGLIPTETHGGFVASSKFEQSSFCAECHQFPQSYAINGKPLENTVFEWKKSRFSKEGKQCQACHMPDRAHQFKGIHDKSFTRSGLDIDVFVNVQGLATLRMKSKNIGHAFPTYVTPKITISAILLDISGDVVERKRWDIVREVFYDDGWQERRDSRLNPDETRLFIVKNMNKKAVKVKFSIQVIPDYFYKGVYEGLLDDGEVGAKKGTAKALISQALNTANEADYTLFTGVVNLSNEHKILR